MQFYEEVLSLSGLCRHGVLEGYDVLKKTKVVRKGERKEDMKEKATCRIEQILINSNHLIETNTTKSVTAHPNTATLWLSPL